MDILSTISQIVHGATSLIILAIVGCTVGVSIFMYKAVIKGDFFNHYDRNL